MMFRQVIHCLLVFILAADHGLGKTLLKKFDLYVAYMRIWVRLNYIPSVAFLIPKEIYSNPQLVVFHLLIPMGYVECAPFFCATMDIIKDTENNNKHNIGNTQVHPIEILARYLLLTAITSRR